MGDQSGWVQIFSEFLLGWSHAREVYNGGGSSSTPEPTIDEFPLLCTDFVCVKFFGHNLKVSRRRVTMCVAAEYEQYDI